MEQNPSGGANRFSTSQEIPCILCKKNIHYRMHKGPPPVPNRDGWRALVHGHSGQVAGSCAWPDQSSPCPSSHFLKSHFNIIFPFTPGSSKWSLSLRCPQQSPVCISPPLRATCQSNYSRFGHPNNQVRSTAIDVTL